MRADAAEVLVAMGFVAEKDFRATWNGTQTTLQWFSQQPQPSEATIDAYDLPAGIRAKLRAEAKDALDNVRDAELKIDRAILMAVNDALNQTNARLNALLDAIDAQATYTTLRTAVALINNLPTRTDGQALVAVRDRITAGTNTD